MMFSINSSLSALRAYGKRMGVHANNVVNLHSTGFVKSRVVAKEGPGQTVTAEIDRVDAHMLERGKTVRGSSLLLTLVEAIFMQLYVFIIRINIQIIRY